MTLTYDNFIETLYKTFPNFKETLDNSTLKLLEDNRLVVFGFFVDHFCRKLGDEKFEEKVVDLLDKMTDIERLDAELDDFCLNVYSLTYEKGININPFLDKLTPRTKKIYDINVDLWIRGNGIKR